MAPCNNTILPVLKDENIPVLASNSMKVNLSEIRKAIPEEAFKKSTFRAYGALVTDLTLWFSMVIIMKMLCESSVWTSMPQWQHTLLSIIYFNITGFFMWCLFMIGHDCGHNTFSDSTFENDLIGHLAHGALLVPFYSWQLSHRRHHMYHNHVEKDYSYPWLTKELMEHKDSGLARLLHSSPVFFMFFPFYAWPLYIAGGQADGNHLIPLKTGRLWQNTPFIESIKCLFSTVTVLFAASVVFYVFGSSLSESLFYYGGPWIFFGWWLVCVTYLQHHDPETLVYDDKDWSFVHAAFETVDRKYGWLVDNLSHHITDGHVVHHLFFTKIPHYNLPLATAALQKFLKEKDLYKFYRFEDSWNFPYLLHKYLVTNGFRALKASELKSD